MHKHLQQAENEYLLYLDKRNDRIVLPERPRTGISGKAWASALTFCPWNAYQSQQDAEPVQEFDLTTLHKMQAGVRMAEMLQEAMVYKYGPEVYEVSLEGEKVRGRCDLVIPWQDHQAVIEIKTVMEPKAIKSMSFLGVRPLKLSHIYQVLAYGFILNTPHMYIVTLHREGFNTWQVVQDGTRWNVLDQRGREWDGMADVNDELSTFWQEVERHYQYMQGLGQPMPIEDPLNHPMGWQCLKKDYNGRTYQSNCKYWCRTDMAPGGKYDGEKGQYIVSDPF